MSVHYKFKSALDFDTISFDGLHISVGDLKKSIIHQKRLGKTTDFELQIINAQTKEEYCGESSLIPKNTSLIIARIPLIHQPRKNWDPQGEKAQHIHMGSKTSNAALDLSKMNGSEEEKIHVMMLQSTMDYDPKGYHRIRGQNQTGEVPTNYRCYKCHKTGHWIKNCPFNAVKDNLDIKRNTGIPKSFRQDRDHVDKKNEHELELSEIYEKHEIPENLLCGICKDICIDAVMIPCCGSSFCDDCVRTALLESEENECPDCKEKGSSPGSLIPNRFLRNSVNAFKNETGYKPMTLDKLQIQSEKKVIVPEKKNTSDANSNFLSEQDEKKTHFNINNLTKEKAIVEEEQITEEDIDAKSEKLVQSSHDEIESDFEDNIIVTVPSDQMESQRSAFKERPYNNNRNTRNPKPPGIEGSPKQFLQSSSPSLIEFKMNSLQDAENKTQILRTTQLKQQDSITQYHQRNVNNCSGRPANSSDMYSLGSGINTFQSVSQLTHISQMQPRPIYVGSYDIREYGAVSIGYTNHFVRPAYSHPRPTFIGSLQRQAQVVPNLNLASVYQGVAAKVGSGIIDDPLEAFNRIMKEKEKRKEERRRSTERRRSRSVERKLRSRHSPLLLHRSRFNISNERRIRTPLRDKRGRSRDRGFRKRLTSNSYSDKSSRSRSWSNPPIRKRSKSPPQRRRSRSRSLSFGSRYLKTDNRRLERRNEMCRTNSPAVSLRRSRSPDCSPYHLRHDWNRSAANHLHSELGTTGGKFKENYFPSNRSNTRNEIVSSVYNKTSNFSGENTLKKYDENIGDSSEPPPPGFEIPPSMNSHQNNWNTRSMGPRRLHRTYDRNNCMEYGRSVTPHYEKYIRKSEEERKVYESYSRDRRSGSRLSKKRRFSKSFSPKQSIEDVFAGKNEESNCGNGTKNCIANKHNKIPSYQLETRKKSDIEENFFSKSGECNRERGKYQDKERYHERKPDEIYGNLTDASENIQKIEKLENSDNPLRYLPSSRCDLDRYSCLEVNAFKQVEEKKSCSREKVEEKKEKKIKDRKKKKKERDDKDRKKNKRDKKDKKERETLKNPDTVENTQKTHGRYAKNFSPKQESNTPDTQRFKLVRTSQTSISVDNVLENCNDLQTDSAQAQMLDLYADICDNVDTSFEHHLKHDLNNSFNYNEKRTRMGLKNAFKRLDSVLDIHDFENDFNEIHAIPEPSKWEFEENVSSSAQDDRNFSFGCDPSVDESGKVTNEIIRRAENAIFTRAINAIRPIEIKKNCTDRQKLYSSEIALSPAKLYLGSSKSEEALETFQITVPVTNTLLERSVEIKPEHSKSSGSPAASKSIKERLGCKISDIVTTKTSKLPVVHMKNENEKTNKISDRNKPKLAKPSPIDVCELEFRDNNEKAFRRSRSHIHTHKNSDDLNNRGEHNREKVRPGIQSSIRENKDRKEIVRKCVSKSYRDISGGRANNFARNRIRHERKENRDILERGDTHKDISIGINERKETKTSAVVQKSGTKRDSDIKPIDDSVKTKNKQRKSSEKRCKFQRAEDNAEISIPEEKGAKGVEKLDRLGRCQSFSSSGENCHSSSDSDVTNIRHKKKRKHKREKKRSSSLGSSESFKRKRGKSKKKSKSSKKKKNKKSIVEK